MAIGRARLGGAAALVTGGCGFIGTHLATALAAAGNRVVVLDRPGAKPPLPLPPAVSVVHAELGSSPAALAAALEGIGVVFHLAARKHSGRRESATDILKTNVLGTWEVLEAAKAAAVRRVVFTSSLYAYGRTAGGPLQEDEPARPATVYGISKLTGEQLLRQSGLESVALRLFFVYGPGQRPDLGYRSLIVRNSERLLRGQTVTVYGDGRQALDYVYIDDVVEALLRAAEGAADGSLLNVGSGRGSSVEEVLGALLQVSGLPASKEYLPADETAGTSRVGDVGRIADALGWRASVPLAEGLRRTFSWVKDTAAA